MSGRRGPRPSCPSGSVSVLARRLVSPTPLRTTTREVPMSQLRWKKRKKRKRRRKRRRNKCFLTQLPPTKNLTSSIHLPSPLLHPKRATIITSNSHFSSLRTNETKNDRLAKTKDLVSTNWEPQDSCTSLSAAGKINIDSNLDLSIASI